MNLLVGRINDMRLAQSFVDYLLANDISAYMEPDSQHVAIFVKEEQHLDHARQEFVRFVEEPYHKRYMSASWQRIGSSPVKFDYSLQSDSFLHSLWVQSGPVTLLLMATALLAYFTSMLLGENQTQAWFGPVANPEQLYQAWRFLTPGLIHFSVIQLLFGLLWVWYFGSKVEQLTGSFRLFSLWLLSILFANLVLYLLAASVSTGYSAPTFALLAYLFVRGIRDKQSYIPVALVGFFVFFMLTSLFGVIGNTVLGLVELVGFGIGALQGLIERSRPETD